MNVGLDVDVLLVVRCEKSVSPNENTVSASKLLVLIFRQMVKTGLNNIS
mgnify:CR=1 FL=1